MLDAWDEEHKNYSDKNQPPSYTYHRMIPPGLTVGILLAQRIKPWPGMKFDGTRQTTPLSIHKDVWTGGKQALGKKH